MLNFATGQFTYNRTERRVMNNETVELMRQLKRREYEVSVFSLSFPHKSFNQSIPICRHYTNRSIMLIPPL